MEFELRNWIVYGLVSLVIVFTGLFFWNLLCAPYRVERNLREEAEKEVVRLRKELNNQPSSYKMFDNQILETDKDITIIDGQTGELIWTRLK